MPLRISPRLNDSEPIQRCGWPACKSACCVYGVWIDLDEQADLLAHAELIQPHLPPKRRDPSRWFDGEIEPDRHTPAKQVTHTRVIRDPKHYGGSTCIFMRPDDYKCALQVAGEAAGEHPWRFKPFYCILHPLDLDEHGRITLDEIRFMTDELASCVRLAEEEVVLRELFTEELEYLLNVKRKT
ncbi:MAG: hypothetical protein H6636_00120 [Anaerolineales bacterium]|nr:hypothetical protein [Anaerolineales bacterium]